MMIPAGLMATFTQAFERPALGSGLLALVWALAPVDAGAVPFWGARESRPPETAPVDLQPGEFVWSPGAATRGPLVVLVSLGEQRAYVYRNGVQIGVSTVSSGKSGHETPTGVFVILQKDKNHRSSTYNNAPMPYTQRLTWDGVALHAGGLPGYPSSHGCVHLPSKFSEELFGVSPMGMTVVVVDELSAPVELAHPAAFAPVDAVTGSPMPQQRLTAGEQFRLEPDKAPEGPVSIVMSSADQRVLVLRNGVEIGRARLTVRNPAQPLGTHAFIMRDPLTGDAPSAAMERTVPTWVAVAMPGHFDEEGRVLSEEAVARVSMPPAFVRAVMSLLVPGTTLFVTDAPVLAENMHPDFTVLSDGPAPEVLNN